ncbi:MAG: ribonuclease Z [Bacteroidales bacterium]|nr:ribonuclease Z [Bacteroidales bacterium]
MSFELTILGSSSALPTSKRNTTAHLLNMNERFFLVDCGEGTQVQLRKQRLSPARIHHVFISHIHGDHVFGLFGLISSLGMMGRQAALNLYGPAMLEEMISGHLKYFGSLPYEIVFHRAVGGHVIYRNSSLEVEAIPLLHRSETFGYLFREKLRPANIIKSKIDQYGLGIEDIKRIKEGHDHITDAGERIANSELTLPRWKRRSYAYISDTAYFPEITETIKGVDLLYHESTFLEKDSELAKKTFHSTARQAAEIAGLSGAGTLLIGHFSTRYKNASLFEDEAKTVFSNTIAVNDGDRYSLPQKREDE